MNGSAPDPGKLFLAADDREELKKIAASSRPIELPSGRAGEENEHQWGDPKGRDEICLCHPCPPGSSFPDDPCNMNLSSRKSMRNKMLFEQSLLL
jgi:hypothetical protein